MTVEPPAATGVSVPVSVRVELVPARRASAAVLTVFVLRLAAAGLGVVVLGLMTRHLGPSRFGEFSLVLAVAVVASRVSELGTTHVVAGEMAARPERRAELAAGLAVVRFAGGLVTAVVGGAVLLVLLDNRAAELAGVALMASVPLAGVTGLVVLASARLRPQVDAALSLGQSALWLASVAAAVAFDWPFPAYGLAYLGCVLAQALVAWAAVGRRERPAWSRWRPAAAAVVASSWPMALAMVMATLSSRLDAMVLFGLRGPVDAGFFSAAFRFLDVFQLFPLALIGVLVPVIARRWRLGDHAGAGEVFRLGATVAVVLGSAFATTAAVVGDSVARSLFGPDYGTTGDLMPVLGLAALAMAIGYVASGALVAAGRVRVVGIVALGALGGTLAADLLLIPRWGAAGAAWATVAVEYLAGTALVAFVERRLGLQFPWSRLARALCAGGVVAAVLWPLRGLPVLALLAVAGTAFAASALAAGALTGGDLRALAHRELALGVATEPARPGAP